MSVSHRRMHEHAPWTTASCNTRCTRPRGGSHSAAKASTWVRSPRLAAHVSSRLPPVSWATRSSDLDFGVVDHGAHEDARQWRSSRAPGRGAARSRAVGSVSKRKRPWEQVPTLVRSGRRDRAMGIAGDRGAGCTGLRVQARGCIVRASRLTELRRASVRAVGHDPASRTSGRWTPQHMTMRSGGGTHFTRTLVRSGVKRERSRASPGLRAVRTATSCDRERTSLRSRSGCGAVHVDGPLAVDGTQMGSGPGRAGGCAGQARDPGIVGDGVGRRDRRGRRGMVRTLPISPPRLIPRRPPAGSASLLSPFRAPPRKMRP